MATESLGNTLLKSTSISERELSSLFQLETKEGLTLGETLGKKNISSADEILAFVCDALGLNYLKDIPYNEINPEWIRNIPINYAKQHEVLPLKDDGLKMHILVTNPLNSRLIDDMRVLFKKPVAAVVTTSLRIQDAINKVYEKSTANLEGLDEIEDGEYDLDEPIIDLLEAGDDDAPVIKLVNTLLFRAVKEKASDIHIEPYERDMVVRFRIDGVLYDIFKPPKKLQNAITSRIKVMGNLNIAEKRLPQDGRIPLKLAGKDIDVRLSTVPTAFGERLVMRLQDRSNVVLELEQLGFPQIMLVSLAKLLAKTHGIILVTGPTGSGKSTTLYACISKINNIETNIITVEDPVEQRIHGIGQIQVNHKIGLTFANGLRAILRQDPNVIMIGEIRDSETADIAINAALTGHLVLSTIHTNDSAGAFPRLIDMGCEPFLIASSLLGVAAQRLIRVLCPHCKTPYIPTDAELATLEITRSEAAQGTIFKAVGCNQCNQKGYIGRTNIAELLMVSDEIRQMIMQRIDGGAIKKRAIQDGMLTLRTEGIRKVLAGITTIEELLTNTQTDE
ncbi:MAG: type II secretion system protein GspE [Bdellovibrionales bacterium CG10_big_fil_rev_8_21_14_0_10_45_34]|nr:MAG: type II secretion system protein GspE [Bdellovibrionales bacterium CG10_big_fil_rev_8_21_14_0_10_45_34]